MRVGSITEKNGGREKFNEKFIVNTNIFLYNIKM